MCEAMCRNPRYQRGLINSRQSLHTQEKIDSNQVITDTNQVMADTTQCVSDSKQQVNHLLIMIFAAGIGSLIYIIRAYLLHASDLEDFKAAYIPWYIFWLIQASLLGMVFYFAIRGGILLIKVNGETQDFSKSNVLLTAAVGALVGLFSKYAIEKLRLVIMIIFTNKETLEEDQEELDSAYEENKLRREIRIAQLQSYLNEVKAKSQSKNSNDNSQSGDTGA